MDHAETGCLICRAPLVYYEEQRLMECCMCHNSFLSNAECSQGHFVCDQCHSKFGIESIKERCMSTDLKDPIEIAQMLMKAPEIHMHGPEHHILAGSALLTAYHNCGGKIDFDSALDEMGKRGKQAPGGVCGLWGSCGAALSCGMAFSIITGSTPLSEGSWGQSNLLTSECLRDIGLIGGPRCCKRDTQIALIAASRFITEHCDIQIKVKEDIVCEYSDVNKQCIKDRCPFFKS